MVDDKENIHETFNGSQSEKKEEKISVVWLNSPHDFARKSMPKYNHAPKRSFSLSTIDASPAFKLKDRKKLKDISKGHDVILEKKAKIKELWENIGSSISIKKSRSKSHSPQQSQDCIANEKPVRHNSQDEQIVMLGLRNQDRVLDSDDILLAQPASSGFSDFEEDELLLSMDVDAVIQQQSQNSDEKRRYHRILIDSVKELRLSNGQYTRVKEISGTLQESKRPIVLQLKDDWYELVVACGDFIHVTGALDLQNDRVVIGNDSENLVIIHPDILLSATTIADSFECIRKSYLSSRTGLTNISSAAMVHGKMLHELFQKSLKSGDFSLNGIKQNLQKVINNSTTSLYSIEESEAKAKAALEENVDRIASWGKTYFGQKPSKLSILEKSGRDNVPVFGTIKTVLDIEERIWSPTYGIKGYIDATAIMNYECKDSNSDLLIPLEFKTGKNSSISHEAQTALYTIMISDKYGVDCSAGILYYLLGSKMKVISRQQHHIRSLIMGRNLLSQYFKRGNELPPMLTHRKFSCQRCYALDTCLFYHKAYENGTQQSVSQSGLSLEFEDKTKTLNERHIQFFKKWDSLISMEENDDESLRREIWTLKSEEREQMGRCFSNMKLLNTISSRDEKKGIGQYTYTFIRSNDKQQFKSFMDSKMNERDPIVISSEYGQVALAVGYIKSINSLSVTVEVDKTLLGNSNSSILESNSCNSYRIDKDDLSGGSSIGRNILINLLIEKKSEKLRELIVESRKPYFSSSRVEIIDSSLNQDQSLAISKVLSARDYAIILGMPGTGKTFTMAKLVKELVTRKKSVLLTSYTHSAVDNILQKLIEQNVDFCRIGNHKRVHPSILPYTAEYQNLKNVEAMDAYYQSKWVVATTCLALNQFDYCIVDEASQLTLPYCLGPIQFANIFVLVGDHYQLSPLVRNEEARKGGLGVSLFQTLSESQPDAVVELRYQYRMNSQIMNLSSTLIYGNRLICANDQVSQLSLTHSNPLAKINFSRGIISQELIKRIIDKRTSTLFINTDGEKDSSESNKAENIQNTLEANIVCQILEALVSCGVAHKQIGILSFYNSQLQLIKSLIPNFSSDLELLTIDKSQGRDKDCIIVSFVRCNVDGNVGNLLQDWRRINVLLTRAKCKLILIGSQSTLSTVPILDQLFLILKETNCIV